ncbi:MAG: GNAT family N-acetyltransferase [Halorientalis sp.]
MIRDARADDLARLRAIQVAALDEPWDGLLEPAIAGPPVVLVTTAGDQPGANDLAASSERNDPVGYAVAIPEGSSAYLAEFAVAAGHRRSGRGSQLMSALCSRLASDGFETLRLMVQLDDDRARAFYDAQGFRVRSLLPHHYDDGDGLELVRSL